MEKVCTHAIYNSTATAIPVANTLDNGTAATAL